MFAGIGGFRQGLENLGGQCVFASEIDKYAQKAYEVLYGADDLYGDIKEIHAKDVPEHDVLVAGTPCQSFSVAGSRGGFDDARGTLFFDVARIANEKQPKAVLIENVKGLVGHDRGKTLDTIVKALNECGYRVDFNVLNSKYFGVPQNRERIFIVAVREDLVNNAEWTIAGTNVVAKGKRRISGYDDVKTFNFDWPEQLSVETRLRDILEPEVDERYYLSEEKTAGLVRQLTEQGVEVNEATKKGYTLAEEGDAVNVQFPNSKTRRGRVGRGVAQTLEASSCNQGVVEQAEDSKIAVNKRYGEFHARPDEVSTALDANYGGFPDNHGQRTGIAEPPTYRIRKLTPLECWRLQGFPDYAHNVVLDEGISDSQRYKMAGNAVTVNVIEAIGAKIIPLLRA
ncbi:DNA (cytosine-5-)-methyltransferase [Salibacterium lacus]|uniref:Cytosine-specific methyltransferase n=1 Tax=Salibacterium lacus TaxID=1898109 RepID=A0ABW5SYP5_9BACI